MLDSGASYHITNSAEKLHDVKSIDMLPIMFGNSAQDVATAIGNIKLDTIIPSTGEERSIILYDVLHVPTAAANLLSVRCATAKGADFQFRDNTCTIKN